MDDFSVYNENILTYTIRNKNYYIFLQVYLIKLSVTLENRVRYFD